MSRQPKTKRYRGSLEPVEVGDEVEFHLTGTYGEGGGFKKVGTGVVETIETSRVCIVVKHFDHYYDCSQRFGWPRRKPTVVVADTEWNPNKHNTTDLVVNGITKRKPN